MNIFNFPRKSIGIEWDLIGTASKLLYVISWILISWILKRVHTHTHFVVWHNKRRNKTSNKIGKKIKNWFSWRDTESPCKFVVQTWLIRFWKCYKFVWWRIVVINDDKDDCDDHGQKGTSNQHDLVYGFFFWKKKGLFVYLFAIQN